MQNSNLLSFEAEDFRFDEKLTIRSFNFASNGKVIESRSDERVTASLDFDGPSSNYDVFIHYFDENDGISTMDFFVGGTHIYEWSWDRDLGSEFATPNTRTSIKISDVHIEEFDTLSLSGVRDGGEPLRIDGISLVASVPVEDGSANADTAPVSVPVAADRSFIPSFDDTIGFGSVTSGGAGGDIVRVTSLGDDGVGSLRWALEELEGRRIVVFDVEGTISLKDQIEINGDVTVAGRTAPGEGITIEGGRLRVVESDVIIQGLRVRPGDGNGQKAEDRDAISIGKSGETVSGVIIDGNSFTWATDEVVATWGGPSNISFTNNIIAEALEGSIHPEGDHSMGMLLGDGTQNVTVKGNLFASNQHRNPQLIDAQGVEFVNNVVYNYGDNGFQADARSEGSTAHLIGNVFIAGPDSSREPIRLNSTTGDAAYYLKDNVGGVAGSGQSRIRSGEVFDSSDVEAMPSGQVMGSVMATAGARNAAGHLGSIDARILDGVVNDTGRIVDRPPTERLVIDHPEDEASEPDDTTPPPAPVQPSPDPDPSDEKDGVEVPDETEAPVGTVRFEADDLITLANMGVRQVGSASEGTVLQSLNTTRKSAFGLSDDLEAGVYDFTVIYFDAADGASKLAFEVNGEAVDAWTWDARLGDDWATDQTLATRTIKDVEIEAGDEFRFVGQGDRGEPLRIDAIEVTRTGDGTAVTEETAVPEAYELELEDVTTLTNMRVESNGAASNGRVLRADEDGLSEVEFEFVGASEGRWDMVLDYFDESDGISTLSVAVNGQEVATWDWDKRLGSDWATSDTRTSLTLEDLDLAPGDVIRLSGNQDRAEPLRLDSVSFVPDADFFG